MEWTLDRGRFIAQVGCIEYRIAEPLEGSFWSVKAGANGVVALGWADSLKEAEQLCEDNT